MKRNSSLKRTGRLRSQSKRRKPIDAEYAQLRRQFLIENPFCQVYPSEPACDVHHVYGRGKYYLDVSTWMAVSRQAHDRIHHDKAWAREQGYLKYDFR